jgi:pseudaminic acid cytidylyltransferase
LTVGSVNRLCVIPARGGSKRIPRKNTRDFAGRPIIAWSIGLAVSSGVFDRVIVSTDDQEIAAVARDWGAEVPFLRPAELADDLTPLQPVMRHAIEALALDPAGVACCLYATAPLLTAEYLREGLTSLERERDLEFALGVTSFDFPILRAVAVGPTNRLSMFWPQHELARSQDLPAAYHDSGQFVWGTHDAWLTRERVFSSTSRAILIPRRLVQDIDTPEDWELAEWKFQRMGMSR